MIPTPSARSRRIALGEPSRSMGVMGLPSIGLTTISVGWTKSTRSMAPRSLKTLLPRPGALATAGSSPRSWP